MRKILMLDDNIDLLKVMRIMIRSEGYEFVGLSDCEDLMEKIRSERPDLMIMDIMMPKMNGFSVCGCLKSDEDLRNIPVILITGSVPEKAREICEQVGASVCLGKPFDIEILLSTIKELFEERGN